MIAMRCRRLGRGFTIVEVMVTLSLVATFSVIAGYLFRDCLKVMREADSAQNRIVQFEFMTGLLRADAWAAGSIQAADESIELKQREGSVVWTAEKGSVQRTVRRAGRADQIQRWTNLDVDVSIRPVRQGVRMGIRRADGREIEQAILPSQLILLKSEEAGR